MKSSKQTHASRLGSFYLTACATAVFGFISLCFSQAANSSTTAQQGLRIADFILGLQDAGGAIRDSPDSDVVNEDSNMEYALIGLAAAYAFTSAPKYRMGLERGIGWLASREKMDNSKWRGSWFYTYAASPPYAPVPTSPGDNVRNVRGVDTTSALFVYLLHLHHKLTGSNVLVNKYRANAKAALNFVLKRNRGRNGFTYSSWQLRNGGWQLWKYQYTADQADVYLGLQAGSLLYGDVRFRNAAAFIRTHLPTAFFEPDQGRYAEGLDQSGNLDDTEEFDMVFPQGYVPWVFGANEQNLSAYNWLAQGLQPDGRLVLFQGDPGYSLSVSLLGLAARAAAAPVAETALSWMLANTYDPNDGGVRDYASPDAPKYSNVAGFTVLYLLGASAW